MSRKFHYLLALFVLLAIALSFYKTSNTKEEFRKIYGDVPAGGYLAQGPIVGAVSSDRAKVWFRTSQTSDVSVNYRQVGSKKWVKTSSYQTAANKDYALSILLTNLAPKTEYEYMIIVDGIRQNNPSLKFTTFPAAGSASEFSFGVLADFRKANETAPEHSYTFSSLSSYNPKFVMIIGDHDHNSPQTVDEKRTMFKRLYDPTSSDMSDYVNLILRKSAMALVWDDHDYGDDNGDKTYANKQLSLQVLREFFPLYPVSDYGDWQKFTYGQADFFMLDMRSQSDSIFDIDGPDKSRLDGDNLGASGQLQWLYTGLKASTAVWKFIVTPSVFNPTPGKYDSWASFQTERQAIIDFINSNGIKNVVLLSADMHFGAIDNGSNSGFVEMLTPSANTFGCITNPPDFSTGTWSEGIYVKDPGWCWGFGLVEVKTNPDRINLYVKDHQNNTKVSYTAYSR